ncbi:quinoprotein glucose dehydrogenase [Chryseolinea serpens]|uniref:Quinoprotein glucose dehydrogenase n=1 Tax=Chryseolinea serpens TaxID=947013 RepID=A0A1M5JK46_9BACT|nr:PQQ-binding-like beta-propeller repeat protein [Chryseolinea serpens]SHG40966.1 quinoprotein glucose dehydrogenase [Chryseolinea serpens]
MPRDRSFFTPFFACFILAIVLACTKNREAHTTWSVYRGDAGSTGYSTLDEITPENVNQLEVAWTYHTGDAREGNRSAIQCNPIIVNGKMYVTSPQLKLVALEPGTGKELWKFDPFVNSEATGVNRGVTYWEKGTDKRIFFSAGPHLYALNADNGSLIPTFGVAGRVDLRDGLGRDPSTLAVWATSPGIIYGDLLIQGTALGEGYDAAPGFVRAYDAATGKIAWTFHTIPQPGEYGHDTWDKDAYTQVGGTNSWAGMTLDEKLGLVFVPTGSPAFDFYGGNRKGENLFGNCLIALDAKTGTRKWHHQLVHHDLWDYDLPAPPTLVTLHKDGKEIDAVAQVTKMGMVFLFERESGEPVYPIEERPVPKSDLMAEETWPTQPFPVKPLPFVRHNFTEDDITNISQASHDYVKAKITGARRGSIYTPPSTDGVVQFPGTRGGAEWGGASFDPETGVLYVNANEIPLLIKMKAMEMSDGQLLASAGEKVYTLNNCTMCHGADRAGTGVFPSLQNLAKRKKEDAVRTLLKTGRGQMPAFPNISATDKDALIAYLFDKKEASAKPANTPSQPTTYRYVHDGWNALTDQEGYPGVKPPWGTLNAIDLNTGDRLWQVPLGEYPELIKKGIPPTGTQNLGGTMVTASGLVFVGATRDEKFRAFDKKTGKLIWEYKLPAGGYATPATYSVDGRQYIVIAAGGGGKVGSPSGDAYVAFALKK